MKKNLILPIAALVLASSCTSSQYHTGNGAASGAYLGAILGSAIGGINGGPRGSDIGTIVGMAGGAIVGAAVGSAADKAEQDEYEAHKRRTLDRRGADRYDNRSNRGYENNNRYDRDNNRYDRNNSHYDRNNSYDNNSYESNVYVDESNSGDDRIVFEDDAPAKNQTSQNSPTSPTMHIPDHKVTPKPNNPRWKENIEIRNITVKEQDNNHKLNRKEVYRISFEVVNHTNKAIYNIMPRIAESSGNKNIFISQGITVECIAPGNGVRFTASVMANNKIKDGFINLLMSVNSADGKTLTEKTMQIETSSLALGR